MKWLQTIRQTVTDFRKMTLGLMAGTVAVNSMPGTTPEAQAASSNPDHPNIIFILADDVGWTDLNCHEDTCSGHGDNCTCSDINNKWDSTFYQTPHLKSLREAGMRFTNASAACPWCKPSRAAIMTGKYPMRLHITANAQSSRYPLAGRPLPLAETTIAEALKAGPVPYETFFAGKWHLGPADNHVTNYSGPRGDAFSPNNQGFDHDVASAGHRNDPVEWDTLIQQGALDYLDAQSDNSEPFFMSIWYYSAHIPLPDCTEWANDPDMPSCDDWDTLDPLVHRHTNKRYARLLYFLDRNVGELLVKLEDKGFDQNTIIIFSSDNGGQEFSDTVSYPSSIPTNNYPLKQGKGYVYEGGLKVPLIIKDPRYHQGGEVCSVPVNGIDFFPTILQMAYGQSYDPDEDYFLDGVSFAHLLEDGQGTMDRSAGHRMNALFYTGLLQYYNSIHQVVNNQVEPDSTLGQGFADHSNPISVISYDQTCYEGYKWLTYHDGNGKVSELYNLSQHPFESNSLSDTFISQDLEEKTANWINSMRPYRVVNNENIHYTNIQAAIEAASAFDVITVPPSVYHETLDFKKNITLTSIAPNDPKIVASTIIQNDFAQNEEWKKNPDNRIPISSFIKPVITLSSLNTSNTVIEGLTICGGYLSSSDHGAGILGGVSTAVIRNCIIRDNTTLQGAGGGIQGFKGTIENCRFINNSAAYGGAIAGLLGTLKNSVISNNTATQKAGAINNPNGATIQNCTIVDNVSQNLGGGVLVYDQQNPSSVVNNILWGNRDNSSFTSIHGEQIASDGTGNDYTTYSYCHVEDGNAADPSFRHIPHAIDFATADATDNQTIYVSNADNYDNDDIIEINNDGIARMVTGRDPYNNQITFEPDLGVYREWPKKNDLELYWSLDEQNPTVNDSIVDSSGNGFHGTPAQTMTSVDGAFGGALDFNGTNDFITANGYTDVTGGNPRTCAFWIKTVADSADLLAWGQANSGQKWQVVLNDGVYGPEFGVDVEGGYVFCDADGLSDNIWHHVAVTLEDSNHDGNLNIDETRLYIDGVLQSNTRSTSCDVNTDGTNNVTLGYYNDSSVGYFDGRIDDVWIYGRALSLEDIQGIMQIGSQVKSKQSDVIYHWDSETDVYEDYHLTADSLSCIDMGDDNAVVPAGQTDIDGDPRSLGTGVDIGADEYHIPQAHWKLDEQNPTVNDSIVDSSGNGFDGTPNHTMLSEDGAVDGALNFNGTNDYITANGYKGITGDNPRTCMFWIKTEAVSADLLAWGRVKDAAGNPVYTGEKWQISLYNGGSIPEFGALVQGGNVFCDASGLSDNIWHHVAVTLEDSNHDGNLNIDETRLYIDGVLQQNSRSTPYVIDTAATNDVTIGYYDDTSVGYFDGQLDDVRIYQCVLSQDEITGIMGENPQAHWKLDEQNPTVNDSIVDSSGNGFDGTPNHTMLSEDGAVDGALNFNGTNDYITANGYKGITGDNPRTCMFWIKTEAVSADLIGWGRVYDEYGDPVYAGEKWQISLYNGGSIPEFGALVQGGNVFCDASGLSDNIWHHVAVTLEDSNNDGNLNINEAKLYIDGAMQDISRTASYDINTAATNDVTIGYYDETSNGKFAGRLDDVRIYHRALSAEEISDLYAIGD